jgi:antitoxin component YwqK of YwqJK toxin-antitoxin module
LSGLRVWTFIGTWQPNSDRAREVGRQRPTMTIRSGAMKESRGEGVDGPQREYFAGGELSGEGRFRNGKRHGNWKFYHRNGRQKATGKYLDGDLYGHWEWWRENGEPLQAGAFKNGKQVGLWKRYYDNGQLWDQGAYALRLTTL